MLALAEGGPELPASLMVVSALFYLAVATWLPQLRRVLTPAVSGTVLMLVLVSLLPFCLDRLNEVPEGSASFAGPLVAVVTLVVSTALLLRAPPRLRSAGEEALSSLLQPSTEFTADGANGKTHRLMIAARPVGGAVELEFVSVEDTPASERLELSARDALTGCPSTSRLSATSCLTRP